VKYAGILQEEGDCTCSCHSHMPLSPKDFSPSLLVLLPSFPGRTLHWWDALDRDRVSAGPLHWDRRGGVPLWDRQRRPDQAWMQHVDWTTPPPPMPGTWRALILLSLRSTARAAARRAVAGPLAAEDRSNSTAVPGSRDTHVLGCSSLALACALHRACLLNTCLTPGTAFLRLHTLPLANGSAAFYKRRLSPPARPSTRFLPTLPVDRFAILSPSYCSAPCLDDGFVRTRWVPLLRRATAANYLRRCRAPPPPRFCLAPPLAALHSGRLLYRGVSQAFPISTVRRTRTRMDKHHDAGNIF